MPELFPKTAEDHYQTLRFNLEPCFEWARKDAKLTQKQKEQTLKRYAAKAKQVLSQGLQLSKNDWRMQNKFVFYLLALCNEPLMLDFSLALKLAQQAADNAPLDATRLQTLAVAQYRTGNPKMALETFERSLTKRKKDRVDFFFMAMCHAKLGDAKTAMSLLEQGKADLTPKQLQLPIFQNWEAEIQRSINESKKE